MKSHSSDETSAAQAHLLKGINSPADLKKIPERIFRSLPQEVRDELVSVLSRTGGHLGPNLGVVELTIALHRVFNTPTDKFVFDVSHQGYVHKLFTGRREQITPSASTTGSTAFCCATRASTTATGRPCGHGALRGPRHGGRP